LQSNTFKVTKIQQIIELANKYFYFLSIKKQQDSNVYKTQILKNGIMSD